MPARWEQGAAPGGGSRGERAPAPPEPSPAPAPGQPPLGAWGLPEVAARAYSLLCDKLVATHQVWAALRSK